MTKEEFIIKWDKQAWVQLQNVYEYISKNSLQNANKVRLEIIAKVDSILKVPTSFGEDKYKKNNDGSYRYFEIYTYRIAFRILKNQILILRVRSTYQEPLEY
ncbi:MAG: type II toxin-antitoxin system RelE/ParE family toxin [Chitinophagaceae bacterium]|nr:type II toxin-antitoxin system RelE/ParE family toxin [Chitinophagaceae bacterium]